MGLPIQHLPIQHWPTNTKFRILNLKDDCGVGTVEGTALCGTKYLQAVRLSQPLTKKGREYLFDKTLLTPNGTLTRVYCLPSQDIVPIGSQKPELSNARRKKGKVGS